MAIFATPSQLATAHNIHVKSADSNSDDSFHHNWHHNSVLSSATAKETLLSATQQSSIKDKNSTHQKCFSSTAPTSTHPYYPLFRLFDENNDGEVSLDEMSCLLRKLGTEVSQSCLISLIESVNTTTRTTLNFSEFTALYESILNSKESGVDGETEGRIDSDEFLEAFNVYDKNKDGYICAEELGDVLRDLGFPEGEDLQRCQTLIDNVDSNGDGLVDLQEFTEMLRNGCGM